MHYRKAGKYAAIVIAVTGLAACTPPKSLTNIGKSSSSNSPAVTSTGSSTTPRTVQSQSSGDNTGVRSAYQPWNGNTSSGHRWRHNHRGNW